MDIGSIACDKGDAVSMGMNRQAMVHENQTEENVGSG